VIIRDSVYLSYTKKRNGTHQYQFHISFDDKEQSDRFMDYVVNLIGEENEREGENQYGGS